MKADLPPFKPPALLRAYHHLGALLAPALPAFLALRRRRGKEDGARLHERLGQPALPRPTGRIVWFHAASVGETLSILGLIEAVVERGFSVLLTSGTLTSAELAAKRLPQGAFHQFVPLDAPKAVARFLDHWRPDLAVFCESELWPGFFMALHLRRTPVGIVNGRMSERSGARWLKAPKTSHALLARLAFCHAQSPGDAARYAALGAPAVDGGNIKFDALPLPVDEMAGAQLRTMIGERRVLLAASTHPGEERIIVEALAPLLAAEPDLLLVLAPRHPVRAAQIRADLAASGLPLATRSEGEAIRAETRLYLADTLGELGLFFALAECAFIGGSLVPHGGHNPIEPALFGVPVLTGPHTRNFRDIFAIFLAEGAAIRVENPAGLREAVGRLIADPDSRTALAAAARKAVETRRGANARALAAIFNVLENAGEG